MHQLKVKVGGMNCNHCKINVETGIRKIPGIENAVADIINGEVTIKGEDINLDSVQRVVENLGYNFNGKIS